MHKFKFDFSKMASHFKLKAENINMKDLDTFVLFTSQDKGFIIINKSIWFKFSIKDIEFIFLYLKIHLDLYFECNSKKWDSDNFLLFYDGGGIVRDIIEIGKYHEMRRYNNLLLFTGVCRVFNLGVKFGYLKYLYTNNIKLNIEL